MSLFYILAILPLLFGIYLLATDRRVVWPELLGSAALAFGLAGVFHYCAVRSVTGDYEVWSGQITRGVHYPYWLEEYTVTVTDYDSKGRAVGSHTETRETSHPEHWVAETSVDDGHEIDNDFFKQICVNFGNFTIENPGKSGLISGDPSIYVAYNTKGYIYPVTTWRAFTNRLKAQPTLFGFSKVPPGVPVYPYPRNENWLHSDRLLGVRNVDPWEFDRMNSRLGPTKKVNVMLVGFTGGAEMGQYQQAAWFGGRKNDLVLCYDVANDPPTWAYCFGWTKSELAKRNIETIALTQGVSTATLPAIEAEIVANYEKRHWHEFDYIEIPAPTWALIWLPIALAVTQAGYWLVMLNSDVGYAFRRSC